MRVQTTESDDEPLNLTPVIDVVFLLLIFFLVATRLESEEREIATRLAEVLEAQPLTMGRPNEVVVNITAKGEFIVLGETLDDQGLIDFIHTLAIKNPGTQTVQIRADQDAKFLYPATVMGLCEREKINHYCTVLKRPE